MRSSSNELYSRETCSEQNETGDAVKHNPPEHWVKHWYDKGANRDILNAWEAVISFIHIHPHEENIKMPRPRQSSPKVEHTLVRI